MTLGFILLLWLYVTIMHQALVGAIMSIIKLVGRNFTSEYYQA